VKVSMLPSRYRRYFSRCSESLAALKASKFVLAAVRLGLVRLSKASFRMAYSLVRDSKAAFLFSTLYLDEAILAMALFQSCYPFCSGKAAAEGLYRRLAEGRVHLSTRCQDLSRGKRWILMSMCTREMPW
jgi:hypothetical protein